MCIRYRFWSTIPHIFAVVGTVSVLLHFSASKQRWDAIRTPPSTTVRRGEIRAHHAIVDTSTVSHSFVVRRTSHASGSAGTDPILFEESSFIQQHHQEQQVR